jgi:hypothetical protein
MSTIAVVSIVRLVRPNIERKVARNVSIIVSQYPLPRLALGCMGDKWAWKAGGVE